ncbi:MAG: protein-L-isoaspartate O-methyltransferase [Patescibacteria group bacterium]|nr:protein-L-isoaspartate O-methyltransferase [Patescibacteria group bacterium]
MNPQNDILTDSLVNDGYLKTPEIIEAFKNIDRADFVPEKFKANAYINAPLPIDSGQTISQPLTVAFMLELLQPKAGEKILDVGSGSGWTTALLSHVISRNNSQEILKNDLIAQNTKVIGMERLPELKETGEKNISKYGFIESGVAQSILGDGAKGYKKGAPFDKILAGAAAENEIPKTWKSQLKIGGRIVAPVGNNIVVIDKISKNKYNKKEYFGFNFVPLVVQ